MDVFDGEILKSIATPPPPSFLKHKRTVYKRMEDTANEREIGPEKEKEREKERPLCLKQVRPPDVEQRHVESNFAKFCLK